jgi:glycosyltransferase involved in cell wall biosynthesis
MGMAGRLTEEKGQLFLLKTLLPMLKDNSNYKLLIAGDAKIHPDTTYPEKIASFIQHSGLNGNVIMTDYIENMNSFYNALDLFLLPSFREPFGRVLIEAMATETPVIASRVGGVPEVVDHEVNGYLVEPGDAVGWREYINRLIHNEAIRRNFIKSGRNKVLKKFTSENITSSIAALYGELLGDH